MGTFEHKESPLNITELDGSPSTFPYKLKVPNGALIDNGDGTSTLNIDLSGYLKLDQTTPQTILVGSPIFDVLTGSKVVFTDSTKHLTSTGIGTSSQFIKGDGSLDSNIYYKSGDTPSFAGATFTNTVNLDNAAPILQFRTAAQSNLFSISLVSAYTMVFRLDVVANANLFGFKDLNNPNSFVITTYNTTNGARIGLLENTGSPDNYVYIKAPNLSGSDYTLTLPTALPASTAFLKSSSGGALSWDTSSYPSGSGTNTYLAYWTGASTLSASSNLTYDGTNFTITVGTNKALDFFSRSGNPCFRITNGTGNVSLWDMSSGTMEVINQTTNGSIIFGTEDTIRLRLLSNGRLLVGASGSEDGTNALLQVQGTVSTTSSIYTSNSAGDSVFGNYGVGWRLTKLGSSVNGMYMDLNGTDGSSGVIIRNGTTQAWFLGINNGNELRLAPMSSINESGLTGAKDGTTGITIDTSGNTTITGRLRVALGSPSGRVDFNVYDATGVYSGYDTYGNLETYSSSTRSPFEFASAIFAVKTGSGAQWCMYLDDSQRVLFGGNTYHLSVLHKVQIYDELSSDRVCLAIGNGAKEQQGTSILFYGDDGGAYSGNNETKWELGADYYMDGTQSFFLYDSKNSRITLWAGSIGEQNQLIINSDRNAMYALDTNKCNAPLVIYDPSPNGSFGSLNCIGNGGDVVFYLSNQTVVGQLIADETSSSVVFGSCSNHDVSVRTNNSEVARFKVGGVLNLPNLPTSASGLSAGDLWNNVGYVCIIE